MTHAQALAHLRAGRVQAAASLLEAQLELDEKDAQGWFLLGACRQALNDLPGAASALSRSLNLDPAYREGHLAYISVLRAAGSSPGALAAAQEAVVHFPDDARILYAAALCFEDAGQTGEALAHYNGALYVAPDFEDALHNRGALMARLGKLDEAEGNQRRYVAAFPKAARAYVGLADVLLALGRFEEVIEALDALDRVEPQDAGALVRRGVALASLRRFDEAREVFANARERNRHGVMQYLQRIAPGSDPDLMLSPENIYLGHGWKSLGQCDWSGWREFTAEMHRIAQGPAVLIEPAVGFMALHVPLAGPERRVIASRIAATIESGSATQPPIPPQPTIRLRIGVLSPDFRDHVMARMLAPLFELVDQTRFETYAYSLASEDGSAIRARIRSAAGVFRQLTPLSDQEAAQTIRHDDIDILIDAAGYTTGARFAIMAQRPARLHVNYLGFCGSMGSSRLDYAIADRIVGSDALEWVEARVFLPVTFLLYDFRDTEPRTLPSRHEYGLPDDAIVYCAFHKSEKISPDGFAMWMEILSQVSRSVLWFRALPAGAIENLRQQARRQGVDPQRLVFASFEPGTGRRYLARHKLGDLLLDALHHNAINSACDALRMGLPVLTLSGAAMASRACASLLHAANLPELVMRDREEYVRTAVRLGNEPALLRSFKQRLTANRRTAPLFDTAGRVRALEAAFQGMYDRMMRGEPPASFEV